MLNTDLGACEQFIYELRRSNLIERGNLDQVVEEYLRRNPRAEANSLAAFLVEQGILSNFQADRVLQGKTQGLVLGPYVLIDAVGAGSMGTVHRAQSKTDNKWYAVKVLPRRNMWNVRLARRQVRSFSQFNHHSVVPFIDVGTSGGLHYLVWPFVDGETLEQRVQRDGRLPPHHAAQLALQIASGLTSAHQHGLFHGLLKPSNIMLGTDGTAKLLDFGIGSLLAENEGESMVDTMSTANTLTSGLDCSSPESIVEPMNRSPAGDQYSLGCTLYFCLTGQYPFPEGSAVEKMMAHQFKEPVPIPELAPDVPPQLAAVVTRLMKKKPDERYMGVDEVVEALQPLVGHYDDEPDEPPATALPSRTLPSRSSLVAPPAPPPPSGVLPGRPSTTMPPVAPVAPPAARRADHTHMPPIAPLAPMAPMAPMTTQPSYPAPPPPPPPSMQVPTRRSMMQVHLPSAALPQPVAPPKMPLQPYSMPTHYDVSGAVPPGFVEEAGPRKGLSFLMVLALGATVALAGYLVYANYM